MKLDVNDRLLGRELGGSCGRSGIKAIYGDKAWVRHLDIINELEGHDGCVNALSWSKNGRLLASGSDDQRLNIHQYQADDTVKSFNLATTVQTGHSANIFSVKFMPHSNDQTLVTAAGDHQVRVFDIEHSARTSVPAASNIPSADRLQGFLHNGTRFLSPADTNARIYKSHSDRVKRIVTESSPHLFLTCSEDGEVRQWDLRQPSSAYPRRRDTGDGGSNVPAPLISYKRYQLDLNTISCSPSQPHYIALGGAHLHAFLHDRRMLGRDRGLETGRPSSSRLFTEQDDDMMGEATRCVRRFAPYGRSRMKRSENGHITACKISDANPNEMIASWSGDYIYSFDLMRSPDARDLLDQSQRTAADETLGNSRARHSRDRKRKRNKEGSVLSQEGAGRAESRQRTFVPASASSTRAFRVQYANGQSEEIPIRESEEPASSPPEVAAVNMSEAERNSFRIANTSVAIRKAIFTLGNQKPANDRDPTGYATSFTSALGFCASVLEDMDETINKWGYPVNPDEVEVVLQTTLKRNRESARRFVQAAGTISRVLGGQLWTGSNAQHPMINYFSRIVPAPNEADILHDSERFRYDFIKAIVLWLDSGPGALVCGFGRPKQGQRFPLPEDASIDAIEDVLIPYLLRIAGDTPIPNVDASRFEVDSNRKVFDSEKAAVLAFASAIKIPFQDLSRAIVPVDSEEETPTTVERVAAQDRKVATKFWGLKVARGLLLLAGEGVNHSFVDQAFGGLGNQATSRVRDDERALLERLNGIESQDDEEQDPVVDSVALALQEEGNEAEDLGDAEGAEEVVIPLEDIRAAVQETNATTSAAENAEDEENGDEDDGASELDDNLSDSDDSDNASDSEDENLPESMIFRSAFSRSRRRAQVNLDVPCSSHIRHYRGHCNVKTVKDVNFYGLNDEYIVSGSDSGHLFIWDKQSTQLVNILEGDGEVVNVVQGHPYEPMLAVSGIDHTVKIFSADAHARRSARRGIGVTNVDASGFSSLRFGRTRFGAARRPPRNPVGRTQSGSEDNETTSASHVTSEPAVPQINADDLSSDDEGWNTAPKPVPSGGLSSRRRMYDEYSIVSQNDVDRRGGQRQAYITQSMLAQLAARVRLQMHGAGGAGLSDGANGDTDGDGPAGGAGGGAGGVTLQLEGGGTIVLGDDCEVM